jgi:ribosomal protein L37AE/L43A
MPQNRVQFQQGMSMIEFFDLYGTEQQCAAALEEARWGRGFSCPKCGDSSYSRFDRNGKRIWQCTAHKHQSSLRTGSIFHASRISLRNWFLAMFLTSQSKPNISALELKRHLGVSYPTAWLLKHKLMQTMAEREDKRQLSGRVVADDAYLGGVTTGGMRGRGAKQDGLFMAAVEVDADSSVRKVRFDVLPDMSGDSIRAWARKALDGEVHLVTDGYSSLVAAISEIAEHEPVVVSPKKSGDFDCFRWVNVVIGNTKNSIRGAYHSFNVSKYARRYLAEIQYRFNRRFALEDLVPRLLYACAQNAPRGLNMLRSAELSC